MRGHYDPTKPGSYFVLGPENAETSLIMLHGSGRNAEFMRPYAERMRRLVPGIQVMVPNGINDAANVIHPARSKPKKSGQGFEYWFETIEEWDEFVNNIHEKEPVIHFMETKEILGNTHLFGTSAGASRAMTLFDYNPCAFASLTLHGAHIGDWWADSLIKDAQDQPHIRNIPITISLPLFDPVFCLNFNKRASDWVANIPYKPISSWGGRYERQQEHERAIKKLQQAGFNITVLQPKLASHFLVDENLKDLAQTIQEGEQVAAQSTLQDQPSARI